LHEARLLGAAQGLRESAGMPLLDLEARKFVERFPTTARSRVEEEAWEKGRAMNLAQAVSYALEEGADG
jgi:hypothetical protein